MVGVKPHSDRWKNCESKKANTAGGTVLYVKAMIGGVMLICGEGREVRSEACREILQSASNDSSRH